jgi:cyclase
LETKRVIPCLLLQNKGLVKTTRFKNPVYIGDPINAVKIFNEKGVDELIFLDIEATKKSIEPSYDVIKKIASECFMPFCYGGGIKRIDQIEKIIELGTEKVCINSAAFHDQELVLKAAAKFGSSTIVTSIDVKKNVFGKYFVFINGGTRNTCLNPVNYAKTLESLGAGEIFLNSIDRDGTMEGYDIDLIKMVASAVSIPAVVCGGAGSLEHFAEAINIGGASAVSAGSFFVFHGKHRAVLITYPEYKEIKAIFSLNNSKYG